ncbi:putative tartrate transporter [Pararobbsia alpina]|uniref:MFS transporter n=1 Tax=Pararobbsia alpina TaxID=621374 RepID=UPI0039A78195
MSAQHSIEQGRALVGAGHENRALSSKIFWRILPLLFLCYVYAYIDRVNVGMAQLQMKQSLPFSDVSYSIGASIFFVGYLIFEVPSNLMLERIGARRTLLRIMVCWGAVCTGMLFVHNETSFYILRFLLGCFEAGFFPGVILFLTYWFPAQKRGYIVSTFLIAPSVALIVMPPAAGAIMRGLNGAAGLGGWQWLFIVSGLPAIVLGIVTFLLLDDSPEKASWLSTQEKAALREQLNTEHKFVAEASHVSARQLLTDPRIYALAAVYFLFIGCVYSMIFWVPSLIKSWGISDLFLVGVFAALPNVCGIAGMLMIGRSSDRNHERRWHFFGATVLAAVGLAITAISKGSFAPSLVGLCVMTIGTTALTPVFFTTAAEYVPKKTAAAGIALISSLGNLGAVSIPPMLVWINGKTGGPYTSLMLMMAIFVLSGVVLLLGVRPATKNNASAPRTV